MFFLSIFRKVFFRVLGGFWSFLGRPKVVKMGQKPVPEGVEIWSGFLGGAGVDFGRILGGFQVARILENECLA